MTARILDGKQIAQDVRADLAGRVTELRARGVTPGLAALLVGDNPASASYVAAKTKASAELGLFSETFRLPAETTQDELIAAVDRLNADPRFHGILPQLPLPSQIDERVIISRIAPAKDVDGLHPVSMGKLVRGEDGPRPCTPAGVQEILMRSGYDPAGKHVVVCGRSNLVGKPLAVLLMQKARAANATVTVCHTGTPEIARFTRDADIAIFAMGVPRSIGAEYIRPGAVVIDVGTTRVEDPSTKSGYRIAGDVRFDEVAEVAGAITPVPGGVGPMTVTMLLVNTVAAAERLLADCGGRAQR
jgi:methylenetetrahydrofolate dehydrogenase (NADP+)/methenyltetrahydrofolate cyclohydrolase